MTIVRNLSRLEPLALPPPPPPPPPGTPSLRNMTALMPSDRISDTCTTASTWLSSTAFWNAENMSWKGCQVFSTWDLVVFYKLTLERMFQFTILSCFWRQQVWLRDAERTWRHSFMQITSNSFQLLLFLLLFHHLFNWSF